MKQFKSFFDRVSIGDIIGGAMNYSFLSSAVFFRVVQKRGKATLICEQLSSITEFTGYHTKIISCDVNSVKCSDIKIRCGKYSARYDNYRLQILDDDIPHFEGSDSD
jgi:hypothetical protein